MSNASQWSGAPLSLGAGATAVMPQTPIGSAALLAQGGMVTGELTLTAGGSQPQTIFVPGSADAPVVTVANWMGSSLAVWNSSGDPASSIVIALAGPGLPGLPPPAALTAGTPVALLPSTSAQGVTQFGASLSISASFAQTATACVIGGPLDASGSNAYMIQLNSPAGNTGPQGPPPPPGFYATTSASTYRLPVPWQFSNIWCANFSSAETPAITLLLDVGNAETAPHAQEHANARRETGHGTGYGGSQHEAEPRSMAMAAAWTGSPTSLNVNQNVNLAQTTNGSMVFVAQNYTQGNNAGTIWYSSGGAKPTTLPVPQLTNQPAAVIANWGGQNLSVTNKSVNAQPIVIQAIGPGLAGLPPPSKLNPYGTAVQVGQYGIATGTMTGWMTLQLTASLPSVIAVVGGPPDVTGNNAYLIALSSPSGTTGVASDQYGTAPVTPAPPGYYATTVANTYNFGSINWGSATIFVANLSGGSTNLVSVTLVSD
jgi:hypothetical protein